QIGEACALEPARRAETNAAGSAEDDVAEDERAVLGEPVDRLPAGRDRARLDAAGQRPADLRAVPLGDPVGAPPVPADGGEHADGLPHALDVAVERAPEALLVLGRHERVEEDNGLR